MHLIGATALQLTHSKHQGETTYRNVSSTKKSAENHDKIMNVVFGEATPTKFKKNVYFRDSDRALIKNHYSEYIKDNKITAKNVKEKLEDIY